MMLMKTLNTQLNLKNIFKIYGTGNTELKALNNISLTINQGDYCAIMGASGSGKSTLMNIIGCLDRPTAGNYYLENQDIAQLNEDKLAKIRNRKIGFVFQQFHLLPQLNALENVMLPMIYAGIPSSEQRKRAIEALQQVGLGNRLSNKPNQLSGGQQQRVAIARAIVNQPVLLLADEPTGALDSHTTQDVMNIFSQLNTQGMTIIIVTHEPEVAQMTHHTIWFRDGQIISNSSN
jgi:putative ABC transport system ATP-binding protein